MKTLKKLRNESVKDYSVLQNRCGCGTCGCVCSGCVGEVAMSNMDNQSNGSAETGYRVNYGAHS